MDEAKTKGLVGKQSSIEGCEEKLQLTVDEVVEEYVGSFGFSQLLQVFLVSLAWMFDSHSTLVTIFTDAQPESWRCNGPECGGNDGGAASVCGLKEGSNWEWIGGNTSSTVAEWGLVCDRRFLAALPPALYFLGSLIGSIVFSRLADGLLGRKRSVLVSCLLTSTTMYLISLSQNIWIYTLLRLANGISRSGIGICSFTLATEAVGRRCRGQVSQYGFFFFAAGLVSLPVIAYPSRWCWRDLYKILSSLPLVYSIFILVPFVTESPSWLLERGRNEEALEVLKIHSRMNGKELPRNISLIEPASYINKENDKRENASPENTKWAVKRLAMVMIMGFGIGFVYYGIQLNAGNLNFNLYFTVAVNAMMEIPAVFVGSVLLGFANRRTLFSGSAFAAGISCFMCIIFSSKRGKDEDQSSLENGGSLPQLMIEAFGFMAVSIAFDVLRTFCVELFPTNVRNFVVSMLRQGLMLGASLSPLPVVFGRQSPPISFLVFGVLSIISGFLSFWLPETRNSPLYETLEQQEEAERFDFVCGDLGMEISRGVQA